MSSNRHVKEVRELLGTVGEGHHAMAVVKAMREAGYEPESWSTELKSLQGEGSLVGFVESCKKNGDGDANKQLVEGLRDLLNMQSLLSNLADAQSAKYSAGRHNPEERDAVYNDTKQMDSAWAYLNSSQSPAKSLVPVSSHVFIWSQTCHSG